MPPPPDRFEGTICGVGTTSGVRIVIGDWASSPLGAFTDVMVEDRDGRRSLLAPDSHVAEYVTSVYFFDDVIVEPLEARRRDDLLRVVGGPLTLDVTIGRRDPLGHVLRSVPRRIGTSIRWATFIDPIARTLLRGVRTRGSTPGGEEYYAATDRHRIERVSGTWSGADLGELAPVDPPVRFGYSSTPRRPSIVRVVTMVKRGVPPSTPRLPRRPAGSPPRVADR